MMKNLLCSIFAVALSITTFVTVADDHAKKAAPINTPLTGINTLSCNFMPDKDMDDYMKLVSKYNTWADENHLNSQSAWIFIPSPTIGS